VIGLDAVVARRADPLSAPIDGELVMLDVDRAVYFGLERIGRRIWELLEEPRPAGALCETLQAEFDVAPERCQADVLAFLEEMERAQLVEVRR
jgi:hypothetical protein